MPKQLQHMTCDELKELNEHLVNMMDDLIDTWGVQGEDRPQMIEDIYDHLSAKAREVHLATISPALFPNSE